MFLKTNLKVLGLLRKHSGPEPQKPPTPSQLLIIGLFHSRQFIKSTNNYY